MDTGTLFLVGQGAKFGSAIGQGMAARAQGRTAERIAKYEAAGLERQGQEELAAAQRTAFDQRKKTDFLISRQRAFGAGSGSSLSSPGLLDIIVDTAGEGEYRAAADMYGGYQRQAGLKDKANVRIAEGRAAKEKGENAFFGSILEGFGGLASGFNSYRTTYGGGNSRSPYRYGTPYG